jgi:hypothetical protein
VIEEHDDLGCDEYGYEENPPEKIPGNDGLVGRCMIFSSDGSKASASVTVVTMLTHRIWTGVIGRTEKRTSAPKMMTSDSAPLVSLSILIVAAAGVFSIYMGGRISTSPTGGEHSDQRWTERSLTAILVNNHIVPG